MGELGALGYAILMEWLGSGKKARSRLTDDLPLCDKGETIRDGASRSLQSWMESRLAVSEALRSFEELEALSTDTTEIGTLPRKVIRLSLDFIFLWGCFFEGRLNWELYLFARKAWLGSCKMSSFCRKG